MEQDLKIIKKKYGEKMMRLCRELFATILDNSPGILPQILEENFYPSHYLYDDLVWCNNITQFKEYIYILYDKLLTKDTEEEVKYQVDDPVTLMKQAGYTLYECTCEEDIQKFKKYYAPREELCTFRGGRLKNCYVYFAVKDNAGKLKRSDFSHPNRQDEYGTSVISIQFTRDDSHTLSIKNRYNHTVNNPDATFSNNLDNIIPELTQSFADYYGMVQDERLLTDFELSNYVQASNGKFYRYNYEIGNVYYCPNNIVINNYRATEYTKEKYLVMDYFVLDLVNKKFIFYPYQDSFPDSVGPIKNIKILNNHNKKIVTITPKVGEDIIIELDKFNRMISYQNNNVMQIGSYFLSENRFLKNIVLDNVREISDSFLTSNRRVIEITLPKVEIIGNYFMCNNDIAIKISLPNVLEIGDQFMWGNNYMINVSLPKLMKIGSSFMHYNRTIKHLELPSVIYIGSCFLCKNQILETIALPNVRKIADSFLDCNEALTTISLPNVETIDINFCWQNKIIESISLPKVQIIGYGFMIQNQNLTTLELPQVKFIGDDFMRSNTTLKRVIMPNLIELGNNAFQNCTSLKEFSVPSLSSKIEKNKSRKLTRKVNFRILFDIFMKNKTK